MKVLSRTAQLLKQVQKFQVHVKRYTHTLHSIKLRQLTTNQIQYNKYIDSSTIHNQIQIQLHVNVSVGNKFSARTIGTQALLEYIEIHDLKYVLFDTKIALSHFKELTTFVTTVYIHVALITSNIY